MRTEVLYWQALCQEQKLPLGSDLNGRMDFRKFLCERLKRGFLNTDCFTLFREIPEILEIPGEVAIRRTQLSLINFDLKNIIGWLQTKAERSWSEESKALALYFVRDGESDGKRETLTETTDSRGLREWHRVNGSGHN